MQRFALPPGSTERRLAWGAPGCSTPLRPRGTASGRRTDITPVAVGLTSSWLFWATVVCVGVVLVLVWQGQSDTTQAHHRTRTVVARSQPSGSAQHELTPPKARAFPGPAHAAGRVPSNAAWSGSPSTQTTLKSSAMAGMAVWEPHKVPVHTPEVPQGSNTRSRAQRVG